MGMILRIASSRIVGQGDIVGRSGYFSLNLSANSVMRGRLDARRTLKSLVADLRLSIKYLRLTKLYESLCIIKKALNIPCTVNLNTEECTKAINILSVKLADANTIAKAISA